jgi:nitroreductase
VVDGRDKVRQMAAMVVDWARGKDMIPDIVALWEKGEDWPLRAAPHVAIACGPKGFGSTDHVIAAATLELAASALGIGACWAGFFTGAANSYPPLAEFLGLPEGHIVHAALMLGYPQFAYHRIPPRRASEVRWIQ